jgi:hypothetical protein
MTTTTLDIDAPGAMPQPFGVDATTGKTHPPLAEADLAAFSNDSDDVQQRAKEESHLALIPTLDAKNLAEAGWGIVFPSNVDPKIVEALQPLIEHRRKLVNDGTLFKVFTDKKGVSGPNQSAIDWLNRFGLSLAPVDPSNGVPFYLLLVGSPQEISFEFQYVLDLQWCVGRVYFETPAEYGAYARAVVDYETAGTVPQKKRVAMWMPQHTGDAATTMLAGQVGQAFAKNGLGVKKGYTLESFIGVPATKPQLTEILRGASPGGPPALLFTGSHGLEWPSADAAGQKKYQGALVTQDWIPGKPLVPGQRFAGEDLPADARVQGMVHFMFACFGGGCPRFDTYRKAENGAPIQLVDQPLVATLPQQMMAHGVLAVMAHIDRAWSWSFQTGSGLPQNQVISSTIEAVLTGLPVGLACDFLNLQWATLAARLGMIQGQLQPPPPAQLANLFIARDDARNYALLGDPAVRLRVQDMAA